MDASRSCFKARTGARIRRINSLRHRRHNFSEFGESKSASERRGPKYRFAYLEKHFAPTPTPCPKRDRHFRPAGWVTGGPPPPNHKTKNLPPHPTPRQSNYVKSRPPKRAPAPP